MLDYRELRQIINATHDRFSSLNFDSSMSLLQKVNIMIEDFKNLLREYDKWVEYFDKFISEFDENLYKTVDDILNKWKDDGLFDDIIADKFLSTQPCYYAFPSMLTGGSGDTAVIKNRGKSFMIDCYYDTQFEVVTKPMLNYLGITSIDYCLITHWHGDHYLGLKPLIEDGFINENSMVIVAPPASQINEGSGQAFSDYTHFMEQNNVPYRVAIEDEVIQVTPDLKVTLWNVDPSKWDGITTDYNQCSIVAKVEHGEMKSLYMSDCGDLAEQWLLENKKPLEKYTLLKQGHHGINHEFTKEFAETISPDYVSVTLSPYDINRGMGNASMALTFHKSNGSRIFNSGSTFDPIVFTSDRFSMGHHSGYEIMGIGKYNFPFEMIVDSNALGFQNGTEKYPFATIPSALGMIQVGKGFDYKIRVKNGVYGNLQNENNSNRVFQDLLITDIPNKVVIEPYDTSNPNVTFNGRIIVRNCSNVSISDITHGITNNSPVSIENSNVTINRYNMTGNSTKSFTGFSVLNSELFISGSTISNVNNGISASHSNLRLSNSTIQNVNNGLILSYSNAIVRTIKFIDIATARTLNYSKYLENDSCTFTNVTNILTKTESSMTNGNGNLQLYSGTLVDGIGNFTNGRTFKKDYLGILINYRLVGSDETTVTQGQIVRSMGVAIGNQYFVNINGVRNNEIYSSQITLNLNESSIEVLNGIVTLQNISANTTTQYKNTDNPTSRANKLEITAIYGLY